jgi:hypothetical protein
VLDADVLVGGRIDLAGDDEVVPQRDRMQVFLGGPAAEPATPLLLEDEAEDELTVITGQVVLRDEQDLQRIGDIAGQRHLRRVPILAAEEGEVLALLERHVVVGVPEFLRVDVTTQFVADDRLEFEDQRISDRFLRHKSNCNPNSHVF